MKEGLNSKVSSTEQVVEGLGQNDEFKNKKKFNFLNDCDSLKKSLILKSSDCVSMKSLFKRMEPVLGLRIIICR